MASFITWNTYEWIQMLLNMATSGRIGWNMFTITWIYTSHLWYERGHDKFDRLKGFNIIERKNMLNCLWDDGTYGYDMPKSFCDPLLRMESSQNGSGKSPLSPSVDWQPSQTFKNIMERAGFLGTFFPSGSPSLIQDLKLQKIADVKQYIDTVF